MSTNARPMSVIYHDCRRIALSAEIARFRPASLHTKRYADKGYEDRTYEVRSERHSRSPLAIGASRGGGGKRARLTPSIAGSI